MTLVVYSWCLAALGNHSNEKTNTTVGFTSVWGKLGSGHLNQNDQTLFVKRLINRIVWLFGYITKHCLPNNFFLTEA